MSLGGTISNFPNEVGMREPTEIAQSLRDDIHAVLTQPKWASEHGLR